MNRLSEIISKDKRIVLGMMSGTSMDSIDASVINIKGSGEDTSVDFLGLYSHNYDSDTRQKLMDITQSTPISEYAAIDMIVGETFAKAAIACVKKILNKDTKPDLIGSHGQTVVHNPPSRNNGQPYTIQLGNLDVIAERTGIITVGDFRPRDIAAGGEGAPIIPYVDYILFRQKYETIIAQNIGGISNLTIIDKDKNRMQAFDTGPGNMIMDGLIKKHTNGKLDYDTEGELASKGNVDTSILKDLLSDKYFSTPPPKTTGAEKFGKPLIDKLYDYVLVNRLSIEDLMRTALEFTVESIALAYENFVYPYTGESRIILSGGGAGNSFLVSRLKTRLPKFDIHLSDHYGIPYKAKESIGMAILANELVSGNCTNIPSCTGAGTWVPMGKIALGNRT